MVEEPELGRPYCMEDLDAQRAEARSFFEAVAGMRLPVLMGKALTTSTIRDCSWIPQGIPEGPLLYPCCGKDIEDALRRFGPLVTACHFSDPFHPPLVERARPSFSQVEVPQIGIIQSGPGMSWELSSEGYPCPLVVHQKDGLLTLLQDIEFLSVFYYRGDSHGEGGSDQRWLWPILFEVVLSKLLEGGLVCTDGSNSDYWDAWEETYSPFAALGDMSPSFVARSRVGDKICWGPRELHCIAEVEGKAPQRMMRIWRMTSRDLANGGEE